ncbi:hypothetical protein TrVE_jg931 [Triparma verrucosa]|uniref:DUF445 domain-containing protein n=1 Tax=Triparma verrucosa TaxID=1606542 RepID=A0A9W7FG26_9STRA|nr:hypothetical protein TrVE_jg931 [Triparma verrucosa]
MGISDPQPMVDGTPSLPLPLSSSPPSSVPVSPVSKFLNILPSNKGDTSNCLAFLIMLLGVFLNSKFPEEAFTKYLLSFGLFSFAGGITNWLAIKMLFDRIPGLYGSGVIPRQFVAIRETVKNTIMKTFFDETYLEEYVNERAKGMLTSFDLSSKLKEGLSTPEFDEKLIKKMTEMSEKPEGMLIQTMSQMFGGVPLLVPVIKPLIIGFADEFAGSLTDNFDIGQFVSIEKVRLEIDGLMTEKLKMLTPEKVKTLMEEVIREHLGWLIVWGNVFGGGLGVISQMAGYGA